MQLTDGGDGDSPMTLEMGCRVPKKFSANYVDRVHIIFFLFLLESPTGGEVTFCSSITSAN